MHTGLGARRPLAVLEANGRRPLAALESGRLGRAASLRGLLGEGALPQGAAGGGSKAATAYRSADPPALTVARLYLRRWWAREVMAVHGTERFFALLRAPFDLCWRLTIPTVDAAQWNRFFAASNTALGPLVVLFLFQDFVDYTYPIIGIAEGAHVPLWLLLLLPSSLVAMVQFERCG